MMQFKTRLLAGVIPVMLSIQPSAALDGAKPFVVAQQEQKPPPPQQSPASKPQPKQQAPQQQQRPAAPPPQQRPPAAQPPQPQSAPPQPQRPQVAPPSQPRPSTPPQQQERREQRQEQRQDLRQNQQQQRQEQRQQQQRDNTPRPERREQRQELRQDQKLQRENLRQDQRQQREDLQKRQQEQRQKPQTQPVPQQTQPAPQTQPATNPARPPAPAPNVVAPPTQQPSAQPQQRPAAPPVAPGPAAPAPQGQAPATPQPNRTEDRARRLEDVRGERQEIQQGNRRIIQEGSRSIIQDGNRKFIRHDENERFRRFGRDVSEQKIGNETRTFAVSPNGTRIVTVTGPDGRLLRRSRFVNDREVVIIDNRPRSGRASTAFFLALPAIALGTLAIPRERYIVEAESAPPEYIYGALMAPPVMPLERAYTLDEIRYSPELRDRMPRIDLDTITFDTGSWEIAPDQYGRLAPIAEGIKRAVTQNPNEVFLIEGHTDAVGNDDDNLSLSDRRAEAVSVVLTDQFQIPPENLTTQGYGEQQLKVPTQGPERLNRRVTVRRITPLLQQSLSQGPNTPISPDQIPEEQRNLAPPAQDQRIAPPRRQNAPAQNQFAPR